MHLICQDTGSKIKGRRVDVFVDDHARAKKLGVRRLRGTFAR
jgi:3D (Asp-Asp-Asp) domain-containing protein